MSKTLIFITISLFLFGCGVEKTLTTDNLTTDNYMFDKLIVMQTKKIQPRQKKVNLTRIKFIHPIPLYRNIDEDNLEEIQSFIKKERELSIHMRDKYGYTPLHRAVRNSDNLEIVKILIENGAGVNAEDRYGETPLDEAIERERRYTNQYAIALLKSHGAKTSAELKIERDVKLKAARADKKTVHPIPFYEDISKGNLEEIQFFIKDEPEISINIKDEYGHTPLHWAIWSSDNLEVIEILIKNGAYVNEEDNKGNTLLDIAIERDRILETNQYAIALLRSHGAKTSAEFEIEQDAELKAARDARLKAAQSALKLKDRPSLEGFSSKARRREFAHPIPFYEDISKGNLEEIQSFIKKERELSIHMRDKDGKTPLRWAVRNSDNLEIVKILIENGADVNTKDKWGEILLDTAIRHTNQYSIALLRSHGAKTSDELKVELKAARDAELKAARTDNKFVHPIPFYEDINKDNLEEIQFFIKDEQEISVNIKDEYQNTPLHWAVWSSDNLEVVKILIENGADVNAEGRYGRETPLDIAIERDRIVGDNEYAIALLRSHGAKTLAELEAE